MHETIRNELSVSNLKQNLEKGSQSQSQMPALEELGPCHHIEHLIWHSMAKLETISEHGIMTFACLSKTLVGLLGPSDVSGIVGRLGLSGLRTSRAFGTLGLFCVSDFCFGHFGLRTPRAFRDSGRFGRSGLWAFLA